MEVADDKPDLVLCLFERTLLRWQMRGLDRVRKKCRAVQACWKTSKITWGVLEAACRQFSEAKNYEIITPLHDYSMASKCLKLGFKPEAERKIVGDIQSKYMKHVTTFRRRFKIETRIPWQMSTLKKQMLSCEKTIVKLQKACATPIQVEAAEVNMVLCPEGVRGKRIEVVFAIGPEVVAIATVKRDKLLTRLKFGKKLRMWKCMTVVKLIRCDVRHGDPKYYSIETKEQHDTLIADLNG